MTGWKNGMKNGESKFPITLDLKLHNASSPLLQNCGKCRLPPPPCQCKFTSIGFFPQGLEMLNMSRSFLSIALLFFFLKREKNVNFEAKTKESTIWVKQTGQQRLVLD